MPLSLAERIEGCLVGALVGAECGFARRVRPERFALAQPQDVFGLELAPLDEYPEQPGRVDSRPLAPLIALGVQAYLASGGRVAPEDFAAQLRDDPQVAGPVFAWDSLHSIQELLREGMHPRLSGLGAAPCGLISAAMPAVGIYHLADPEYAYLDGVELASVAQPREGADWAGLCAAAVAAAFPPGAGAGEVVDQVLRLAHRHCPDLFYRLNQRTRQAQGWAAQDEAGFAAWWLAAGGRGELRREENWIAWNPLAFVLPLLAHFADRPMTLLALLVAPGTASWYDGMLGGHTVSALVAGAIVGALHGPAAFPEQWRRWAAPQVAPWLPLTGVVTARLQREGEIVQATERLLSPSASLPSLEDKVYGCLLAGAIGNAMGSPVEGRMYWEIDRDHPGGITTVLDPRRLEGEDDNQMAMLLVETYLEQEGLPVLARHFGRTWRERLNRDHFYVLCMGHAYDLIRQGWDPRITGHWSVVTGSTVMCMEPVGLYHLADPEFARQDATTISYMYQRGRDVSAAAILAAAVAEAMAPQATVDSVLSAALAAAPRQPLLTFDQRPFASAYDYLAACLEVAGKYDDVLAVRPALYEKCLLYHMIDPLELLGFALAMFRIARGDVRLAAIGGTNIGRDSDTIAGRAAMLSGTLHGAAGVPEEWKQLFRPESLERIARNARRLAELIAGPKTARLRERQAALGARP